MKKVFVTALIALTVAVCHAKGGGGGHGGVGHASGGHATAHSSVHTAPAAHVSTPAKPTVAAPTSATGHSWWPFRPWAAGGSSCTDQKKKEGRC